MNSQSKVSGKDFWEQRYISLCMPWDIGQAAPPFVKYLTKCFSQKTTATLNVAVLGSGRGHDAFYFAKYKECNFNVYGFDFSDSAIKYCNELKEKDNIQNVVFHKEDFFKLTQDKRWESFFDLVIEHTSLAAIDPKRREEYANLISYLLKPGGNLVGLFFVRPKELGGPPFGITPDEVRLLFQKDFIEIEELHSEECLHGEKLKGKEYFGVFEKKQNFHKSEPIP